MIIPQNHICTAMSFSVALLMLLTSCSSPHKSSYSAPLGESLRRSMLSVAVVPASFIPDNNFNSFARGPTAGAGRGAASGAIEGVKLSTQFGPFFPLVLPIITASGAAGGAAVGAVFAMPADEADKMEEAVKSSLQQINVQENLAGDLVEAGSELTRHNFTLLKSSGPEDARELRDYHARELPGIDLVIEVAVTGIGFSGGVFPDRELSFYMDVRTRGIPLHDQVTPEVVETTYRSRPRKVSHWSTGGASALGREFENAYREIAKSTVEQLFLVQNLFVDAYSSVNNYCRLRPFSPPPPWPLVAPRHFPLTGGSFSNDVVLRFANADSLQPVLRWEAFPTEQDLENDTSGLLRSVSNIHYDLKLWRGHDGYPDELIYEKQGLAEPDSVRKLPEEHRDPDSNDSSLSSGPSDIHPGQYVEHKINLKLEPATEYFWTVRARFDLDRKNKVAKWSHYRIPWIDPTHDPCLETLIPLTHYYRFRTPQE